MNRSEVYWCRVVGFCSKTNNMRTVLAIAILLSYSFSTAPCTLFKKKSEWIKQEWATGNPEIPEKDEYDIRLTMNFKKGKLSLHNSRHVYPQYVGYKIDGKKLTLLRNDIFKDNPRYHPVFTIRELSKDKMELEAENWAAVYITSVLSTLWVETTETDFVKTDSKDLTYGGMLQTDLILSAVK